MYFWWFKKKWSQIKAFVYFIRIVPDLKTRSFVILLFVSLLIASFFIGLSFGKMIESRKQIEIKNLSLHVPYNKEMLARVKGGAAVYSKSEGDKNYVASDSGSVYYSMDCKGYSRIKEENRVWFKTKEDAELRGYRLAKTCKI